MRINIFPSELEYLMKDKLFDALKRNTADYAEIRVEFLESTNLLYRGRDVENALSTS